jgi:hypothetical protein
MRASSLAILPLRSSVSGIGAIATEGVDIQGEERGVGYVADRIELTWMGNGVGYV